MTVRLLWALGACDTAASQYADMSLEEAWRAATSFDLAWLLTRVGFYCVDVAADALPHLWAEARWGYKPIVVYNMFAHFSQETGLDDVMADKLRDMFSFQQVLEAMGREVL